MKTIDYINKECLMKIVLLLIFVTVVGTTGGCSTYKQRDEGLGKMGYEEIKLEDGTYKLSYYGSSLDDAEDVTEKWNKRASELCGKGKYQADVTTKEWAYDGYTIIPPLIIKSKGASPLVEGKLVCKV